MRTSSAASALAKLLSGIHSRKVNKDTGSSQENQNDTVTQPFISYQPLGSVDQERTRYANSTTALKQYLLLIFSSHTIQSHTMQTFVERTASY